MRGEVAADRLAVAVHRAPDDRAPVDRMRQRTAYAQVVERRTRVVDRQQRLALGRADRDGEARVVLERGDVLGRGEVRVAVDVAGEQRRERAARVRQDPESDLLEAGRRAPVVGVAHQHHRIALAPLLEPIGTGAHRGGGGVGSARRTHDDEVAPAEVGEQFGDRAREFHLDSPLVDDPDCTHRRQQVAQGIGRVAGAGAIERPAHVRRRQRQAIVEPDAAVQRESVAQAVLADVPVVGERRGDLPLLGDARQPLVDVAVDDVLRRLGRGGGGIEVGRLEREAECHGRAGRQRDGHAQQRGRRQQRHGNGHAAATTPGATHGAPCSSVQAARAMTWAEVTRSSMETYSSGWWARSRMPGPYAMQSFRRPIRSMCFWS